jgi:carbonic anhydrase/acetyltransferase-like protein (isoleucine patch superfamily)
MKPIQKPVLADDVFVAEGARIYGDVAIDSNSSVWFNAVIRSEEASVKIGKNCNIQDNATLHTDEGYDLIVEDGVSIGHNAILHGCTIGENTLVGMGAIVMNGACIGKNCILAAGTLVSGGKEIPDNSLVIGTPGKVVKTISQEQIQENQVNAQHYVQMAEAYQNM